MKSLALHIAKQYQFNSQTISTLKASKSNAKTKASKTKYQKETTAMPSMLKSIDF